MKAVEKTEMAIGGACVYFLGMGLQIGPEHVCESENQFIDRLHAFRVFHVAKGVGEDHHIRF